MELLSIIIRSEGNKELLEQTLKSLGKLAYPSFEVIVADRLSGAGAGAALPDRSALDESLLEKLRVVTLPEGAGPGVCLNAACRLAQGSYVTFLKEGTVLSTLGCSAAADVLRHSAGRGWCYAAAQVQGTGELLPPRQWKDYKKEGRIFPDLASGWSVALSSVVLTMEQLLSLDGFDEDLPALAEEEFLLRLSLEYPAMYLKMKTLDTVGTVRDSEEALISRCFIISEFLEDLARLGVLEGVILDLLSDIDRTGTWETAGPYLEILKEDARCEGAVQAYFEERYPKREIKPSDTGDVSGVQDCVGCGSCQGICPEQAVSMEYNEEGFLYPRVDQNLCTKCGICLGACPTQIGLDPVPIPRECLALQAEDGVRMSASSGGVFPLLARHVLKEGGSVAGAVFDGSFNVHHVVSSREKNVRAMQTSKYVQSDTSRTYPMVRELLEDGQTVLFTGCACQVAGLKAFLGKPYDRLYTMDVVCHGVPSPKVWQKYLMEFLRRGGKVAEVDFRKKSVFGWKTNLYVRYASGKEYRPKGMDLYLSCFLSDWTLRESCYECPFKGMKYSDLTAGDFWGIQYLEAGFEDGKGSSSLTVNTEKGAELFRAIEKDLKKCVRFGAEETRRGQGFNPSAVSSVARPPFRDAFFDRWKKDPGSLQQAVAGALSSLKALRFDVGLILHWSPNFGNALTNYALYTFLAKDRKVVAVDNCGTLRPQGAFREFAQRHFDLSSAHYPSDSIQAIEGSCGTLLVGSDQVWNLSFNRLFRSGKYYQLDFAGDSVRKVAYGASFGMKGAQPPKEGYAELYRRFHRIGVREAFGVDVCRETYGADAQWVLDPVFLPDRADYDALAEESGRRVEGPFILAYILNPDEEKRRACLELRERLGGDMKVVSICEPSEETIDLSRHVMDFAWIQKDVTVEDFLYLYRECSYVITDSFHGTCFSLIYRKQFMSFVNRQPDRFTVFEQFGKAAERIGRGYSREFLETCLKPLDYEQIEADMEREREKSRKWLEEALQ